MTKKTKDKLGYTWWVKDWNADDVVFELTLEQRGLYRELIDRAMMADNQAKLNSSTLARRLNCDPTRLLELMGELQDMGLITLDGDTLHVPSCEKRLAASRKGRKGGLARAARAAQATGNEPVASSTPSQTPSTGASKVPSKQKQKQKLKQKQKGEEPPSPLPEKTLIEQHPQLDPFEQDLGHLAATPVSAAGGGLENFTGAAKTFILQDKMFVWEDGQYDRALKEIFNKTCQLLEQNGKEVSADAALPVFQRMWEAAKRDKFHWQNLTPPYFERNFNKLINVTNGQKNAGAKAAGATNRLTKSSGYSRNK